MSSSINSSTSHIRSDALTTLRPFFENHPTFKTLGEIFRMAVIVDANIIIRDILWLSRKRKNAASRTEFYEVLMAGTITAYAPTFLEQEIAAKLPVLAGERNLSLEELMSHWQAYRSSITFVDVGGVDGTYDDPKDAPYLKLQAQLGALILSKDTDIARMGGRVADTLLVTRLRLYSRRIAVEYSLKAGGTSTLIISLATLTAVKKLISTVVDQAKKMPRGFWLGIFFLMTVALLHPPTRHSLSALVNSLFGSSREAGKRLLTLIEQLVSEHEMAKQEANSVLNEVKSSFL